MKTSLVVLLFFLSCWLVVSEGKGSRRQLRYPYWGSKRVGFKASLRYGQRICGHYYYHARVIYKNVHYNSGHYSQCTGIFTAPVSGYYDFSFSGQNYAYKPVTLQLMKNGRPVVSVYSRRAMKLSKTKVLKLAKRDRVYIRLRGYTCIYSSRYYSYTFSGQLRYSYPYHYPYRYHRKA